MFHYLSNTLAVRSSIYSISLLVCVLSLPSHAQPGLANSKQIAVVEGIQLPAWVEREGRKQPLQPGMALQGNERLHTGQDARVLLRLSDGSAVRLGAQAELKLEGLVLKTGPANAATPALLQGAVTVLKGAFRFTTDSLAKLKTRRELDIRFATVTAGIRGTDLWGKNAPDKEIVCLIEGKISVDREFNGEKQSHTLEGQNQFYIAPVGKPNLPIGIVPDQQLATWAAEVELQTGKGILQRHGATRLQVGPYSSLREALTVLEQSKDRGYPFSLATQRDTQGVNYSLVLSGIVDQDEAKALGEKYLADLDRGGLTLDPSRLSIKTSSK
ncbi:FecR family protein [Parvibium lacunae]|uniref:FecR protein domain-containing protein n=1 Tax=Parvibium lacunae TaxID=1888893 RepID=A0A368L4H3_9BURK|nr:FecR family protein [Parvibium lacunae]RCS58486.1 hypothetical protein DU000_06660 [Parvibium lacunae]